MQHSPESSSYDSALFEDIYDETYLSNETLETPKQSSMTLRPTSKTSYRKVVNKGYKIRGTS